jgi:hypothetical protein
VGLQTHCQCAEKLRSSESFCSLSRWTRVASDAAKKGILKLPILPQKPFYSLIFFAILVLYILKKWKAQKGDQAARTF